MTLRKLTLSISILAASLMLAATAHGKEMRSEFLVSACQMNADLCGMYVAGYVKGHKHGMILSHVIASGTYPEERDGASAALITAALLHDIGWTLRRGFPRLGRGLESGHEDIGAELLGRCFNPEVTEPIALHVLAKRHLVATEAGYAEKLSAGSVASLESQGLPLTKDESTMFLARDHAEDALVLRRWDEDAKTPGAATPDLDHFRPMTQACLKPRISSHWDAT